MASLLTLKREAGRAARWRGHDMEPWYTWTPTAAHARCRRCGVEVVADANPPANGISIGGEAVAVGCIGA